MADGKIGALGNRQPAIDRQCSAVDHGRAVAQQEEYGFRHFIGIDEPAEWYARLQGIGLCGVIPCQLAHRRQGNGRIDAVDADAGGPELCGKHPCHGIERGLRGAIGRVVYHAATGGITGDVDDRTLNAKPQPLADDDLRQHLRRDGIDVQDTMEVRELARTKDCNTVVPAQLTRKSTGSATLTADPRVSVLARSTQIGSHPISETSVSRSSGVRLSATTFAPRRASMTAVALPMPFPAPVNYTRFPSQSMRVLSCEPLRIGPGTLFPPQEWLRTTVRQNEKSLPREEVRQAFENTEQQLGGGCCCSRKRPREEDKAACKHEALREEVHRFDETEYTDGSPK